MAGTDYSLDNATPAFRFFPYETIPAISLLVRIRDLRHADSIYRGGGFVQIDLIDLTGDRL